MQSARSNMTGDNTNTQVDYGRSLFVAGLSDSCEFTDLHDAFEPYGRVVLCRVLKDAKTGRSRRVGYVNFEDSGCAARAMHALQGKIGPGGAPWDIKIAAQDPTFKPVETKKVFVRYVPLHVTVTEMRDAFSQFGEIEDCVVTRDLSRTARREPGPWNMAYVTYRSSRDAIACVARAQSLIRFGDQELTVKPAVSEETLRLRSKFRQAGMGPGGPGAPPVAMPMQMLHGPTGLQQAPSVLQVPPGFVPALLPASGPGMQPQLVFVPANSIQQQQQQQPQPVQYLQQNGYARPGPGPQQPPQPQPQQYAYAPVSYMPVQQQQQQQQQQQPQPQYAPMQPAYGFQPQQQRQQLPSPPQQAQYSYQPQQQQQQADTQPPTRRPSSETSYQSIFQDAPQYSVAPRTYPPSDGSLFAAPFESSGDAGYTPVKAPLLAPVGGGPGTDASANWQGLWHTSH
jgi:RNA recognition motif-containing protein